jgi:hypothetical protein
MDVGKEEFRKFANLLDLLKIEVYGEISDSVYDQLQQKVEMLGKGTVVVHDFNAGFFNNRK